MPVPVTFPGRVSSLAEADSESYESQWTTYNSLATATILPSPLFGAPLNAIWTDRGDVDSSWWSYPALATPAIPPSPLPGGMTLSNVPFVGYDDAVIPSVADAIVNAFPTPNNTSGSGGTGLGPGCCCSGPYPCTTPPGFCTCQRPGLDLTLLWTSGASGSGTLVAHDPGIPLGTGAATWGPLCDGNGFSYRILDVCGQTLSVTQYSNPDCTGSVLSTCSMVPNSVTCKPYDEVYQGLHLLPCPALGTAGYTKLEIKAPTTWVKQPCCWWCAGEVPDPLEMTFATDSTTIGPFSLYLSTESRCNPSYGCCWLGTTTWDFEGDDHCDGATINILGQVVNTPQGFFPLLVYSVDPTHSACTAITPPPPPYCPGDFDNYYGGILGLPSNYILTDCTRPFSQSWTGTIGQVLGTNFLCGEAICTGSYAGCSFTLTISEP